VYLLLIRHGQSENNKLYAETGEWAERIPDPGLTDLGRTQANKLAEFLSEKPIVRPELSRTSQSWESAAANIDVLYCSLMRRAVATAAPIAEKLGLDLHGHLLLHEVCGVYEGSYGASSPHQGSPASELQQITPNLIIPEGADESGWYRGGFEKPAEAWVRAQTVIKELLAEYGDTEKCVALVVHAWFMQFLLRALIDWPPREDGILQAWYEMNNTGHIMIKYPGGIPAEISDVLWVNRTDHLAAAELTV
jgi:2,3-bisphosphoglycerate-dependent phosphoglycerate mutase